ncbi:MAG TPA: hypothetical protein VF007_13640, partial [Stellaceae bacterium]
MKRTATEPADRAADTSPPQRGHRRLLWIGAGVVLAAIVLLWSLLPVSAWLEALRGWIVGLGLRGVVVFAVIYMLGAVVLAPEALLTILAGFAYGFWGLPIVLVAATIG